MAQDRHVINSPYLSTILAISVHTVNCCGSTSNASFSSVEPQQYNACLPNGVVFSAFDVQKCSPWSWAAHLWYSEVTVRDEQPATCIYSVFISCPTHFKKCCSTICSACFLSLSPCVCYLVSCTEEKISLAANQFLLNFPDCNKSHLFPGFQELWKQLQA